jgi:short subunit fatty acids transporter
MTIAKIPYTSTHVDSYGIVVVVCIFTAVSFMYFYCRHNEQGETSNVSDTHSSSQARQ